MKRIVLGLAVCICGSGCIILDDTWEPAVVVHDPTPAPVVVVDPAPAPVVVHTPAPAPVVVAIPDYGYDWYRGQWVPHYDGWYYYNNSWCWGRSDRKAPHRPPHWKPDKRRKAPPPRYDKHPDPKKRHHAKPAPKPAPKKPVVKPAPKRPAPKPVVKPAPRKTAPEREQMPPQFQQEFRKRR